MPNAIPDEKSRFTIRLIEVRDKGRLGDLERILQRMYPRRTREELQTALQHLPLVLTRSASAELVHKVKRALEPHGGVVNVTRNPSEMPGAVRPSERKPSGVSVPKQPMEPIPSGIGDTEGVHTSTKRKRPAGAGRLVPMGVTEILDRSFRLLRQRFWLFFLILLIPQAAAFLINKALGLFAWAGVFQGVTAATGVGLGISALLAVLVFVVLQIWAQGALINGVSETYLDQGTSVSSCYGAIRDRLGRLLATLLLMWLFLGLIIGGAGAAMAILVPVLMFTNSGKFLIILSLIVIGLLSAYLFLRLFLNWLMTDKVVVLEGKKGMAALRRSRELMTARTEQGFWQAPKVKAALILLMGFLIGIGIHLVFQIPVLLLQLLMSTNRVVLTLTQVLGIVPSVLATTYAAIALVLYYYDIRIRKEGFDLKVLAQEL